MYREHLVQVNDSVSVCVESDLFGCLDLVAVTAEIPHKYVERKGCKTLAMPFHFTRLVSHSVHGAASFEQNAQCRNFG